MLKRWGMLLLKLLVTAALLALAMRKVDVSAAWAVGKTVTAPALGLSIGLMVIQVVICALRWRWVVMSLGGSIPSRTALSIYWIGNFFGLVLPGAVGGDAVRMWKTRQLGMPLGLSVNSVMLERLSTLFGLVLLVSATEPLLIDSLPVGAAVWLFPAISAVGALGVTCLCLVHHFPPAFHRWSVGRMVGSLAHHTRRLYLRPKHLARLALLVFVGLNNMSLSVYALAVGLGIPLSMTDCIVLIPPVILMTTLPLSVAGWGARELAMVSMLGMVGVTEPQALALSVLFGLVTMVTALPGGLWWLLSADRRAMHPPQA